MNKKRILLITTGGTIASEPSNEGLKPGITSQGIMNNIYSFNQQYNITTHDLFQLDSSNIQPEEWQAIARCIYGSYKDYDGVVVTHGTDTMAYTASVLSFMLKNLPIPVVLTGSQLPISHPLTDAKDNLLCAFTMAASEVPGVFIAFNRKVLLGTRAVKVRTKSFDAFESVNCPPAAKIDVGGLVINNSVIPAYNSGVYESGSFELKDGICPDVFLIKLIPGLNPGVFDMLPAMNCKGLVIEAFGAGGMHFVRRNLISGLKALADRGIMIVVSSQCLYEACDFTIYQTGMQLVENTGIIQAGDMTTEAAVTKLMWSLGQSDDPAVVRSMFTSNLAGETDCDKT
jgi:L-asparaginase